MKVPREIGYGPSHKRDKVYAENDPYMPPKGKGLAGITICKDCTAVYQNKKWFLDAKLYEQKKKLKDINLVICPACKKTKENVPNGVVTLKGDFLKQHKQEILNLIHNEDARSKTYNPLKRIMKINEKKGEIEILTTSAKLAQRIGSILFKAYSGEVEYKKHENAKFMRVEWRRDTQAD
ncbi:MAG: ATPase [Planctomycetes bacterium]|nr:ATPase [Planctomycetota bacterium]